MKRECSTNYKFESSMGNFDQIQIWKKLLKKWIFEQVHIRKFNGNLWPSTDLKESLNGLCKETFEVVV